jgi:hypothetical protein
MLAKQTPQPVPPRASTISQSRAFSIVPKRQSRRVATSKASAIPQTDNLHPTLTTQQILQIARIFDPTVEDELAQAHTAWNQYQSTRRRDAVYGYLRAVFEIVGRWKKQGRAKAKSRQALMALGHRDKIRSLRPFSVVIVCTSDPRIVDPKTRSKWSRALRYAERFKPGGQSLAQFIKSQGGINKCARRFA